MILCMKINIKVFYKLIPLLVVAMAKHAKRTKITSLQYLKKGRDKVGFLYADKQQTSLQLDTISFGGHAQSCQSSQNKYAVPLQYLKKK